MGDTDKLYSDGESINLNANKILGINIFRLLTSKSNYENMIFFLLKFSLSCSLSGEWHH